MSETKKKENEIWFDKLQFEQAVKSLEQVSLQLCHARDDTYHRARAEAERDAFKSVIKDLVRELVDAIKERNE